MWLAVLFVWVLFCFFYRRDIYSLFQGFVFVILPIIQRQILVVSKTNGRGGARWLLRSLTLGTKI